MGGARVFIVVRFGLRICRFRCGSFWRWSILLVCWRSFRRSSSVGSGIEIYSNFVLRRERGSLGYGAYDCRVRFVFVVYIVVFRRILGRDGLVDVAYVLCSGVRDFVFSRFAFEALVVYG